ncbi:MAG TPA: class III extradiol ring-cleavage dioxygenase [Burkholderiales bacterium]|nr:class III extradiol ring-cleavage dioxygenase [Burkholderiales bacterium]
MSRLPAIFVSHGAPTLPLEESAAREFLVRLGGELPRPRAILAVSAHWDTARPEVSAAERPGTIHDFYGFPPELYRLRYPAPGAPELARRLAGLLGASGLAAEVAPDRGLDHGAWVPLMLMYPAADIPVTQLSIQSRLGPAHHVRLGEALRPLRDEGVLVLASGGATHNLREWRDRREGAAALPWAVEFNEWLAQAVLSDRREDLIAYRTRAPHAVRNHPTDEHLLPLFVALGAGGPGGRAQRLHTGMVSGVLSMDAYRFD